MNRDRIGSFVLFAFGLCMAVGAVGLTVGTIQEPGAGLFPLIVAAGLCLVSLIRWIRPEGAETVAWRDALARTNVKPAKIVLVSVLFVLAMEPLGYAATSALYLLALFFWVCRFRLARALLLTLLIAPAGWLFFAKLLSLQLPVGPWGF